MEYLFKAPQVTRILLALLISVVSSQFVLADFIKAKLFYVNGKTVDGLAELPEEPSTKFILYKPTDKADKVKISCADLKAVNYYFKNNVVVEMERIPTWQYGLKMVKKVSDPVWLTVFKRGHVTLYGTTVGGSVRHSASGASITPSDTYCFVKKKSEKEAMLIHYKINATIALMTNKTFQYYGEEYFADYPQLAAKIKNKEYTYKDLEKVVDEYNTWVKTKKK